MARSAVPFIAAAALFLVAASPARSGEDEDRKLQDAAERREAVRAFTWEHHDQLGRYPFYGELQKAGYLNNASVAPGDPPSLRFPVKWNGGTVQMELAMGQDSTNLMMALGDGRKVPVDIQGDKNGRGPRLPFGQKLGNALNAAQAQAPAAGVRGVPDEELRAGTQGDVAQEERFKPGVQAVAGAKDAAKGLAAKGPESLEDARDALNAGGGGVRLAAETRNGVLEHARYQRGADGKESRSVYARQTPYGTRYLESPAGETKKGVEGFLQEFGGKKVYVEYSQDGASARVTHVLSKGAWTPIGETRLAQDTIGQVVQAVPSPGGGRAVCAFEFKRGENGEYTGRAYAQQLDPNGGQAGWAKVYNGKPLAGDDLALARREVALRVQSSAYMASAEAKKAVSRQGWACYPGVSRIASGILQSARPGRVSVEDVRGRAPLAGSAALPGRPDLTGGVVGGGGSGPAQREFVIMASGKEGAAESRKQLEAHKKALEGEALNGLMGSALNRAADTLLGSLVGRTKPPAGGSFADDVAGARSLSPDRVTVVLATEKPLADSLAARVNPEIDRMGTVAAGYGAATNPQSGRAENRFGRLGGRIAANRVAGNTWGQYGSAQAQMAQERQNIISEAARQLELQRIGALREAKAGFAEAGVKDVQVLELKDGKQEAAYSRSVGRSGVAVPYRLADGGAYFLRLGINEAALPKAARVEGGPTTGQRLVAGVDFQLNALARANPGGLTRTQIDEVWVREVGRRCGVTEPQAREIVARIHGL